MKKKFIIGNWKMNSDFDQSNQWLVSFLEKYEFENPDFKNISAIICPPAVLIDSMSAGLVDYGFKKFDNEVKKQEKKIQDFEEDEISQIIFDDNPICFGAQDCHHEEEGAFTGSLSAKILMQAGADCVIVGHSERRNNNFENDELIAKKIIAAVNQNLVPILCVGESKEIRDQNQHLEFVLNQLLNSIPQEVKLEKLIIAYEPIWAIGTGAVPSRDQISQMAFLIKKTCEEKFSNSIDKIFILYGGSVDEKNSQEILSINNIDGLLIGKTSLDVNKFFEICLMASKI